jgi:hypothetical protein
VLLAVTVALLIGLAACGGDPVGNGGNDFDAVDFSFADAAGDTINPSATATGRATDLTRVSGSVDGEFVVLTLTFAQTILPWSSGGATALDGYVDFDMDENEATGIPAAVDEYGGTSGIGAEVYLSLRDNAAGSIAVVDAATGDYSVVAATFAMNTVTFRIPRTALKAPNAEQFRIAAVVGNRNREATDFAPNSGYLRVTR